MSLGGTAKSHESETDRGGEMRGRVALVTGASRGIGRAIAERLASAGARVICTARTLEEGDHPSLEGSLHATVAAIEKQGGEAVPIACDVSDFSACERAVETARATFGPIDVLVNNAALTYFIPVADFPVSRWERSFAVNVHGPFYMSKLVLADMLPRRSGAILNISSAAAIGPGRGPYPKTQRRTRGGTLYGAEKAALERFTQGLASEVFDYGISVTCLSPSQVVATPGVVLHGLARSESDAHVEPIDYMADAALILCSEPAERISGRVTYSQEILAEYGRIAKAHGVGGERPGSGFSRI